MDDKFKIPSASNSLKIVIPVVMIPFTWVFIYFNLWFLVIPLDLVFIFLILWTHKFLVLEGNKFYIEKPLIKKKINLRNVKKLQLFYFPLTHSGNTHQIIFHFSNKKRRFDIKSDLNSDIQNIRFLIKVIKLLNQEGTLIQFERNADSPLYKEIEKELKVEKNGKIIPKTLS